MGQGNYDHPSYITRQIRGLGASTAGANGLSGGVAVVSDTRIRQAIATVRVAGTSASTGHQAILLCVGTVVNAATGTATSTTTATLAAISLNTLTAYVTNTSSDINQIIKAGSVLLLKNGTDATGTYDVSLECYLDPQAVWTGNG
jgi:hypothetical protein